MVTNIHLYQYFPIFQIKIRYYYKMYRLMIKQTNRGFLTFDLAFSQGETFMVRCNTNITHSGQLKNVIHLIHELSIILFVNLHVAEPTRIGRGGPFLVVCLRRPSFVGVVAEWIRRWTHERKVMGSNPGHGTEELGRSSCKPLPHPTQV